MALICYLSKQTGKTAAVGHLYTVNRVCNRLQGHQLSEGLH